MDVKGLRRLAHPAVALLPLDYYCTAIHSPWQSLVGLTGLRIVSEKPLAIWMRQSPLAGDLPRELPNKQQPAEIGLISRLFRGCSVSHSPSVLCGFLLHSDGCASETHVMMWIFLGKRAVEEGLVRPEWPSEVTGSRGASSSRRNSAQASLEGVDREMRA